LGFGLVVGWVTYRTLRRRTDSVQLSDIASVIGAIGGGAVMGLSGTDRHFGAYGIGLAVGFFGYFVVGLVTEGKASAAKWMLND